MTHHPDFSIISSTPPFMSDIGDLYVEELLNCWTHWTGDIILGGDSKKKCQAFLTKVIYCSWILHTPDILTQHSLYRSNLMKFLADLFDLLKDPLSPSESCNKLLFNYAKVHRSFCCPRQKQSFANFTWGIHLKRILSNLKT